jgi:hypothetical protein
VLKDAQSSGGSLVPIGKPAARAGFARDGNAFNIAAISMILE